MANKFCSYLSDQYHFNFDIVRPCCWIRGADANIFDKEDVKAKYERFSKVDDWIPECNSCKLMEDRNLESWRMRSNNKVNHSDDYSDPINIEIQIDDTCNAACIMCGDWTSTTWNEYNQKVLKLHGKHNNVDIISKRIESIKNIVNFDTVRRLSFLGGEPFKTSTHVEILKEIKNPKNVKLHYITNASIFPDDETLKLLLSFQSLALNVSIDGIDDHFNYIRWPLQWKQIVENLEKFNNLKKHMNIHLVTSYTINPFNVFYTKEYSEWATLFGFNNWFKQGHGSQGIINLNCVPPSLNRELIKKYGAGSHEDKLTRYFDKNDFDKFINYIEFHDKARKLSWRDTFPEVAHHFDSIR
jgi:organic radical activating enzyme